jgi:hypothetical protein
VFQIERLGLGILQQADVLQVVPELCMQRQQIRVDLPR